DISVLKELIERNGDDWQQIFKEYQEERKPDTDAIAELSYRNFLEMSSKTADEKFLLRKKIERAFSDAHPDQWVPLYSLVTFSELPYSEALRLGDKQARIMDEVMRLPEIEKNWDSEEVENEILYLLKESNP